MVLSTYSENQRILNEEGSAKIDEMKKFKETKLGGPVEEENVNKNPYLDKSLRSIIDDFVLTWHKIILDLLDLKRYNKIKQSKEIVDILKELFVILVDIFWVSDRIFYIGVGFVILSFFVYFIMVSS